MLTSAITSPVAGFIATGPRITVQPFDDDQAPSGHCGGADHDDAHDSDTTVWGTEDALAVSFTRRYQRDWRYIAAWGKWLMWDGQRWRAEAGEDDMAIVRRALDWIGDEFSYSLDVPPSGRNAVDDFLFETKLGFCQHFSSAFANLMRASGIPSRVVLGYTGGYRNRFGEYWVVRKMDAHAWVEIWLPDQGWVRVDPTAAVAPDRVLDTVEDLARREAILPTTFAPLLDLGDWARRSWNDLVLGFNAARQASLLRPLGIDSATGAQLSAAFAVGAGLALALTLWVLMRGRPRPRHPLEAAWLAFGRRLGRAGLAKRPSEAPLSYGERLADLVPGHAARLRSLSRRYATWRYAPAGLAPAETTRLIADLRAYRPDAESDPEPDAAPPGERP